MRATADHPAPLTTEQTFLSSPRRRLSQLRSALPEGKKLPLEIWQGRHRAILILLWFHAVVIPVYAYIRNFSVVHAALEAMVVVVPGAVATSTYFGQKIRTLAASLAILSTSAVLVHLSGGLIEMHFHFFIMVTVVALYQDWIPFLLAIGYVLVHHGLLGALDPESVFNHPAALAHPWKWAAIHAFFIAGISAVCLVSWRLNESLMSSRLRAEEEKAELYESEKIARAQAEKAQQRLQMLAEASERMIATLDPEKTLSEVAKLAVPALSDACIIDFLQEDGSIRRIAALNGYGSPGLAAALEGSPPEAEDGDNPIVQVLRTGRPLLLENALEELVPEALRNVDVPASQRFVPTSTMVVPLNGPKSTHGSLSFVTLDHSDRRLGPEDLSLAQDLARRAGSALENAQLYARERTVAETLQRSLLPEKLPEIPGLLSAAKYSPGGPGVEVGGDWYDVFLLPGGNVGIAIGDVMGRGIPAASLMGQLRNALRAYAYDGLDPGQILIKLDRLVQSHDSDYLATVVFMTWNPEDGNLRVANAAHPPPLMLRDGVARFISDPVSVPLGAIPNARFDETEVQLNDCDTLILYTDGLVEDRETGIDAGLRLLSDNVVSAPGDIEQMPEWIVTRTLHGRTTDDDVAVLVVRPTPLGDSLKLRVPADPKMLQPLRASLRRWLKTRVRDHDELYRVLLACGEACANAIEHGSRPFEDYFEVEAVADRGIAMVVRDVGRWRPARPTAGGRGLGIMESFADVVEVRKLSTGTEVHLRWGEAVLV